MYNTYTYDFSKDTGMNMNLNIADCFEEIDDSLDINDILDNINYNFIKEEKRQEEKEKRQEEKEPVRFTKTNKTKYKK